MVKIIIFGLFINRLNIERILDDFVEVIGYSDIGPFTDNFKTFEYKPFYQIDQLKNIDFDYILICNNDKKQTLYFENILSKNGILKTKIIPTYCLSFQESSFQSTYDEYIQLNQKFEGAIFGMSYSRRGLIPELLNGNFYKFSLNGMDLHAYELYIENLLKNAPFFQETKYIIMDFPYYVFSWDICSSDQIYFRLNMFDEFNDWGHFKDREDSELYISQWHSLKTLVGRKFESNDSIYSNSYMFSNIQKNDVEDYPIMNVWNRSYMETIEENRQRFLHICNLLNQINATVFIVVFPFSPTFIEKNSEVIKKNASNFYKIIDEGKNIINDLEVLDFIQNPYAEFLDTFFYEPTHLNLYGAIQMSTALKNEMGKKISPLKSEDVSSETCNILYSTYVSGVSWMPWGKNGSISGLSGNYRALRGIKILIKGKDANNKKVSYAVYSKKSGWSPLASDGAAAIGNDGDQIEGIKISLDKESAKDYDIKYSVYLCGKGWTDWKFNNEIAGNVDELKIQSVKIMLCKK